MPLPTLHGLAEVCDQRSWPWIAPRTNLDVDFEETETTDLGRGEIVSDFHEIYWTKRSGEFAYARDSRIVLTIREGRLARYEMRFAG